jgi:hypothetical protein
MPLLVNLTTGTAVGYDGVVRAGEELRLSVDAEGLLHGTLDGVDVTRRLYTTDSFTPGVPFTPLLPDPRPRPIRLARGDNSLWFLSLALYDHPGLDAALIAMASTDMVEGVFGDAKAKTGTAFDVSVFYQPVAVVLDAWWTEQVPASFRFEVPAGAVQRAAGRRPDPEQDRARLFAMLSQTIDQLRAAAVVGEVRARPLVEVQRMSDRCAAPGNVQREVASPGEDRAALGALFDLTALEGARLT